MKRYTAMEVVLNAEDPMDAALRFENFGRRAAMRHRLLKSELPAKGNGKTTSSTESLGAGAFKTVRAPVNATKKPGDRFVLAKAHEREARVVMADVVVAMALFGQRRTTVYFSRQRSKSGDLVPEGCGRVLVFLPRAEGREAYEVMKKSRGNAQWNGWFAELFHQVRELHFRGVALFDLKPENVLAKQDGESLHANLIDLGLFARPWRPSGGSPGYMITYTKAPVRRRDDDFDVGGPAANADGTDFTRLFWTMAARASLIDTFAKSGLDRPTLTRVNQMYQKALKALPKGEKLASATYGSLGTFGTGDWAGRRLGLLGVYADIAALAQTALDAGIVNEKNADAYAQVVLSAYSPSAMAAFVDTLGGPEPVAAFPYCILKADGVAVRIATNVAVNEASVTAELRANRKRDEWDDEPNPKELAANAVRADADTAWRALQSVDYIYAAGSAQARAEQAEISALKKEVCSRLIDRIPEAKTAEHLTRLLRGVLAATLVNSSKVWYTRKTKSANAVRQKVQSSAQLRDVLNRYVFTAAPLAADVSENAFANAIAASCPGVPEVFANHHAGRSRRLLELVVTHFGKGDETAAVNANATSASVRQELGTSDVELQDDPMGLSEAIRRSAKRLFGNVSDEDLAAYTEHLTAAYGGRPDYVTASKVPPAQEALEPPKSKSDKHLGYAFGDDDSDDDDD